MGTDRLGRWTLGQELGRGSFGAVFLARAEGVEQPVALKVLTRAGALDPADVARFEQEASIAARLDHPGLVRVIEVGRSPSGLPWMAMEYCPGPTLAQLLKDRDRLPPGEAAALVGDLARTISHAHRQGIIHRDLKPSNVIIDQRTGRPRITDFGLARDTCLGRSLTATGEALGSPYYMSPEQVQARKDVDPRADVWALGVILYQCLCGQRPFEGKNSFIIARAILGGPVPPPSHFEPAVPPHLDAVCMRALEREREDRFPVAEELALALEAVPSTIDPDAGQTAHGAARLASARLRPAPAPARGGGRRAALIAAVVLLAGLVGAVAVRQGRSVAQARRRAAVEERVRTASTRSAALDPLERVFEALDDAERAAAGDPELVPRARLARADLLGSAGRPDEAAPILAELAARGDRIGLEARWLQVDALEDEDDPTFWRELDALAAADPDGPIGRAAAARLDPSLEGGLDAATWQAGLVRASCRARAGDLEAAAAELERFAQSRPHDPRGWRLRAELARLKGDAQGERSALERAFALCREFRPTMLLLARARAHIGGDMLRLRLDVEEVSTRAPQHSGAVALRGVADWLAGRIPDAVQGWRELAQRDPQGFLTEAMRLGARIVPVETNQGLADMPLGWLLMQAVEWQPGAPARELTPLLELRLRARARAAPEPARAALAEALLAAARGAAWAEVAPHLEQARAAAPQDPVVLLSAARLLCGRDRHAEAEVALASALDLAPWARAELLRLRGELAMRRGSPHRALVALAEASQGRGDAPDGLSATIVTTWLEPYWGAPAKARDGDETEERRDRDVWGAWDRMRELSLRAIGLAPEHPRSLGLAGMTYRRDKTQWAVALIDGALQLEGQVDAQLLTWRAEAMAELLRGGEGQPREPHLERELAHAYRLSDGGVHRWQPALRTALRSSRGRGGRRGGDPAWAGRMVDEALRLDPDQSIAHLMKGALLMRQEAPKEEVLRAWERARELDPGPIPAGLADDFLEQYGSDAPR